MIAESKRKKYAKVAKHMGINLNEAWDDVEYVDLEVDEDFMEKAIAIKEGQDYSTDVSVPLDLPDDLLMFAFKAAHAENMTFNDWMNQMLRDFIDKVEAGEYTRDDAQDFLAKNTKPTIDYQFGDEETEEE